MKILQTIGAYHCGECGYELTLRSTRITEDVTYVIGWCRYWDCSRRDKTLKIPFTIIDCEEE